MAFRICDCARLKIRIMCFSNIISDQQLLLYLLDQCHIYCVP